MWYVVNEKQQKETTGTESIIFGFGDAAIDLSFKDAYDLEVFFLRILYIIFI